MAIDRDSLAHLRAARARIEELEGALELARTAYHDAVRRVYSEGASLRELASGLGISHQRIHQIVGVSSATPAQPVEPIRLPGALTECNYCGAERRDGEGFVPGPGVGICESCVNAAESAVDGGYRGPSGVFFSRVDPNAREHCAFCKKRARQVNRLVGADEHAVCDECLGRCRAILTRKAATAAQPARAAHPA